MLKKIKYFLRKIIFTILYRNKNIFYGKNSNSLDFGHLIFWNLARPGRSLTRIRYNRFLFPKKNSNGSYQVDAVQAEAIKDTINFMDKHMKN